VISLSQQYEHTGEDEGFIRPLGELQERIGIEFEDESNLRAALTHPSFWGEFVIPEPDRLHRSYERLEFLGDSVVALSVCSYLFEKHPDSHQGHLSKFKGHLVSKKVLLKVSRKLGLGEYIRVGKGVDNGVGRDHSSFLVDCYEALVGAIYLEVGFEKTRDFVIRTMKDELGKCSEPGIFDYKTTLQEVVQKQFKCLPHYSLAGESGPEHKKTFTVNVYINGNQYGEGNGRSKKEAEISAARNALKGMDLLD